MRRVATTRANDRHQARLTPYAIAWTLPGHGDVIKGCGAPIWLGCLSLNGRGHGGKAWVQVRKHSCDRRECPTCFRGWAGKLGRRAARRMQRGIEWYLEGRGVHVIASPPQDVAFDTAGAYRRLRSRAVAVLKTAGYRGGNLIFHPWRCKDGLHDGPHFHAVVVGWYEGLAELYHRTGWIVKPVQDQDGHVRVLEDQDAIARVLVYALTHAGVGKNLESGGSLEALTWWGTFATSKLHLELELELDAIDPCPLCDAPMARVVWIHEAPGPPFESGLVEPELVTIDFGAQLDEMRADVRRRARDLVRAGLVDETAGWWDAREVLQ